MVIVFPMVTTIQVSERSKEELFIIKALLEQNTGKKHTLDEAIQWLLTRSRSISIEDRKKLSSELCGIINDAAIPIDELTKLRQARGSRFADF